MKSLRELQDECHVRSNPEMRAKWGISGFATDQGILNFKKSSLIMRIGNNLFLRTAELGFFSAPPENK
jgi:hypothetical protein